MNADTILAVLKAHPAGLCANQIADAAHTSRFTVLRYLQSLRYASKARIARWDPSDTGRALIPIYQAGAGSDAARPARGRR